MDIEDKQTKVSEILTNVVALRRSLNDAEDAEAEGDFEDHIEEAKQLAESILDELRELSGEEEEDEEDE